MGVKKKVVQLCNYGEARILFADVALHVAFSATAGPLLSAASPPAGSLLTAARAGRKWENKSREALEEH